MTLLSRGSIINTSTTSEYEYDGSGRISREKIKGGINRIVDYRYDEQGNLAEELITESDGQIKTITYEREDGRIIRKSNNGAMYFYLQGSTVYDDRSIKQRLSVLEDMEEQDIVYEYDAESGLITKETTYNNEIEPYIIKISEYTYNPDGSVDTESVEYNGAKLIKKYIYDSQGNILRVQKKRRCVRMQTHFSMTQIKTGFRPLFDKMVGTIEAPVSDEEVELLKFMLSSDIIFDGIGHQYIGMLDALGDVNPVNVNEEVSQEQIDQDLERQEKNARCRFGLYF